MGLSSLTDAVALITGGASGIGLEVGRQLVAGGARVVLADVQTEAGERAAAELGGHFVRTDVRDPAASEAAVAVAEEVYGGLDLAVLNAGVTSGEPSVEAMDLDRYRQVVAINTDGVFYGVRAALPALRRRGGGAIVVTASLSGLTPYPGDPVYCMTKHAVVGLVRALAEPLAADAVTINCICPGFIDTPLLSGHTSEFTDAGFPLLDVAQVAGTVLVAAASAESGQAWVDQPGRERAPYRFRGVPGALGPDGTPLTPPLVTAG